MMNAVAEPLTATNSLEASCAIMSECTDGSLWGRTGCILSYGDAGGGLDIAINYVVFFLNLVVASLQHGRTSRAAAALLFVVLFQIVLCLAVHCSGISVVWCAIGGWILHQKHDRTSDRQQVLTKVGISVVNMGVIFYYAIVAEPITTVAHICAVLMGILLSKLSNRFDRNDDAVEQETAATILLEQRK